MEKSIFILTIFKWIAPSGKAMYLVRNNRDDDSYGIDELFYCPGIFQDFIARKWFLKYMPENQNRIDYKVLFNSEFFIERIGAVSAPVLYVPITQDEMIQFLEIMDKLPVWRDRLMELR